MKGLMVYLQPHSERNESLKRNAPAILKKKLLFISPLLFWVNWLVLYIMCYSRMSGTDSFHQDQRDYPSLSFWSTTIQISNVIPLSLTLCSVAIRLWVSPLIFLISDVPSTVDQIQHWSHLLGLVSVLMIQFWSGLIQFWFSGLTWRWYWRFCEARALQMALNEMEPFLRPLTNPIICNGEDCVLKTIRWHRYDEQPSNFLRLTDSKSGENSQKKPV